MVNSPQAFLKTFQVELSGALGIQLRPQLLHPLVPLVLRLLQPHLELRDHLRDLHVELSWQVPALAAFMRVRRYGGCVGGASGAALLVQQASLLAVRSRQEASAGEN